MVFPYGPAGCLALLSLSGAQGTARALRAAGTLGPQCGDRVFPRVAWAAIPLAVYIGFDILVANTVIVFLTGGAVSPLRSAILTLLGYFNLAQSFAAFWILLSGDEAASVPDRVLTGVYDSVRVLATAGPPMERLTPSQKGLAVVEMLIGIYFLVIIFAIYASWAKARPDGKAEK